MTIKDLIIVMDIYSKQVGSVNNLKILGRYKL